MLQKILDFFLKKKIETATETITQTSKTKIFISIEALLRAVEFVTPYFGHPVIIPEHIHQLLYTLAGLSYAERAVK
jgi:hypothetical protein